MKNSKAFLTAGHLKWLALIFMVIDHTAVVLIEMGIFNHQSDYSYEFLTQMVSVYEIMRNIGRLAFPIYLYLLLEGYHHTRNLKRYFTRLAFLAVVSEIPFDLAFANQPFYWDHQNVFIELLIALLLFACLDHFKENWLMRLVSVSLCFGLAYFTMADYDLFGILAALILYFAYGNRIREAIAILPAFSFEYYMPTVFLSSLFILCYNGKRGRVQQAFHYWAYPGHILLLYLIKLMLFNTN
ncbi:conjugal transfer protein TraX [Facklamia sp. 7083-14-GEN3]|uniref:conjugal transfer protein TraX n=1 Tax=Facklamia sp. 7083-14-GEN3 TaxID=2973478 RepID=UPI00215C62A2|nr:conjugal transfer protein TraX [Facklamia sp. 7083-14-GEN3]MCR8968905.1 conjugal transfer protein TraX [Facklamia sp. 7083-14-GEN3]